MPWLQKIVKLVKFKCCVHHFVSLRELGFSNPLRCLWIWAISGVWGARSKNKYCHFFFAQTSLPSVRFLFGWETVWESEIKHETQISKDRLLLISNVSGDCSWGRKVENRLIILSVTSDIRFFDVNIKECKTWSSNTRSSTDIQNREEFLQKQAC